MLVEDTIKKYNMIHRGDRIIVAVSGGPDSVCLLHVLFKLKEKYELTLFVAHVNHQLRGLHADEDMRFVREMSESLGLPFYAKVENVAKLASDMHMSLEQAGRYVRYNFFRELKGQLKADKIAVAHNKDDQAETVLLHFLRGTGTQGLTGMDPVSGDIIRPLIEFSRKDIETYIKENGLKYRTDYTNYEINYTRNRIRLELIPYLREHFNRKITDVIVQTADILREEDNYIQKDVEEVCKRICHMSQDGVQINLKEFSELQLAIKRRLIKKAIQMVKGNDLNVEFKHINYIIDFVEHGNSGNRIDIPGNLCVGLQYGKIKVFLSSCTSAKLDFSYSLVIPGETHIEELNARIYAATETHVEPDFNDKYKAYLDYEKLPGELFVRTRKNGDYIVPFGMKGRKKLKDYFIDAKVPIEVRDRIPLIASGSEIIWIIGHRINERYKITENTRKFLILSYEGGRIDA